MSFVMCGCGCSLVQDDASSISFFVGVSRGVFVVVSIFRSRIEPIVEWKTFPFPFTGNRFSMVSMRKLLLEGLCFTLFFVSCQSIVVVVYPTNRNCVERTNERTRIISISLHNIHFQELIVNTNYGNFHPQQDSPSTISMLVLNTAISI